MPDNGLPRRARGGYPASPTSFLKYSMTYRVSVLAAFAAACIAAVSAPAAHAQSKRDLAAAAALQQRMEIAEKHYRDAMLAEDADFVVLADPDGTLFCIIDTGRDDSDSEATGADG